MSGTMSPPSHPTEGEKPLTYKVLTYITYRERLLLFSQPDSPEAGIQIPGGSLEPDEVPETGALREAIEETGLTELRMVSFLGEQVRDLADYGLNEIYHRYFYHLECLTEPPETWEHLETLASDGSGPHRFSFFWVPLTGEIPALVGERDFMLPELLRRLGFAPEGNA